MTLHRAGWCGPEEHHPTYCKCPEQALERWRQHNATRRARTPNTLHDLLPEAHR